MHLQSVVENLHSYFDVVVCAVVEFARSRGYETTVDAALQALRVHEEAYLSSLTSEDPFRLDDFGSVMFGAASPLSPLVDRG